jgi:RiboL-PSP-HEPN
MALTVARHESAIRFREAQAYLSDIKERERSGHSAGASVARGLFIVLLYGATEHALSRAITEVTLLVNQQDVLFCHVNEMLYPFALDPELASITAVGRKKKWERRAEVFRRQRSNEMVRLDASALLKDLDNVWANTFTQAFIVLGISGSAHYDQRVRQYIDQVAERRNAVAHGRESAEAVGRAYTTGDLQTLLDEISQQVQYMFVKFEEAIIAKSYIKSLHLSGYT